MYIPKHFDLSDRDSQLDFIELNSFGDIVTCKNGQLEINHAPFILDEKREYLLCHLAKANSHWQRLENADDLRVCFKGPDCYISPSWYANANNVPTWNFVSIQVKGKASLMNDEELLSLLINLSDKHESQFESPWTIDKMEPKRLDAMRRAIVGLKISIDEVEGKAKLSQNKSENDRQSLINGLNRMADEQSHKVSELMRENNKYHS